MDSKADIQCNKLMQLENSMLMYSVYNTETLEKVIKTVQTYTTLLPRMRDCLLDSIALLYLKHFMCIL